MGTLANGIKDIFSTSQTTATHLPVCASDGTPQGRISVGDLASVLGVQGKFVKWKNWTNGLDANNLGIGLAFCGENCINVPDSYCQILTMNDDDDQVQMAISFQSLGMYIRKGKRGVAFDDWVEVAVGYPSFYKNYSSFELLVNAIFGSNNIIPSGHSTEEYGAGIYTVNPASNATDLPSNFGNNHVIVFKLYDGVAIAFDVEGSSGVYTKRMNGGEWHKQ